MVVDHKFGRVKVKHPRYVLFHHMIGSLNPKKLLDAIRTGELSEVLAYFPEWSTQADDIASKYEGLIKEAEGAYALIKGLKSQKEFASYAIDTRFSAALFMVRAGKAGGFREYFRDLRIETLADMLGLKKEEAAAD